MNGPRRLLERKTGNARTMVVVIMVGDCHLISSLASS